MAAKRQKDVCITPGCGKTQRCRGLCDSCYFSARKMVKTKQVPGWSWLVKKGLALAEKRKPFMAAVSRAIRSEKPTLRKSATKGR